MGMAWLHALSGLWLNVEALTCFGSFCLSLLWLFLAILWLSLTKTRASGEGRWRLRRALLLLPSLLLFSSFSFASSISGYTAGSSCFSSQSAACAAIGQVYVAALGTQSNGCYVGDSAYVGSCITSGCIGGPIPSSCSASCTPSSSEPLVGSGMGQNGNSIAGNFCDSNTGCVSSYFQNGSGGQTLVTSGASCVQCGSGFNLSPTGSCVSSTAFTASTPSSSCPSGYSVSPDGCSCQSGSTYVSPTPLPASCQAPAAPPLTAPVLSPVSPVTSNGQTSCPSGSSSISNGSLTSCYVVQRLPQNNTQASPGGGGGGGGGNSTFHLASPTKSSNGQYSCPPGASVIGSGSSMVCVVSGVAPTASTGSGTSPTGSASSGNNFPTSFSMPTMPTESVSVLALSQIASARESTSESCPSPVTFSVMNHTFSITFTYACQLASQVRPVVIGVFSLASLLLIVK